MKYILVETKITAPGIYEYSRIPLRLVQVWLTQGNYTSVLDWETLKALEMATDVRAMISYAPVAFQPGDEALVVNFDRNFPFASLDKKNVLKCCKFGILKRLGEREHEAIHALHN